jgi:hypothetical protein
MRAIRIPNEEELNELENYVLKPWQARADDSDGWTRTDRIVANLQALLDLARTVKNPQKVPD